MKTRNKLKIIAALVIVVVILNWGTISDLLKTSSPTGYAINPPKPLLEETAAEPEAYFCAVDDCEKELVAWLGAAEHYIHCAFFEVELESVKHKLIEKSAEIDVRLITDTDYIDQVAELGFATGDERTAYMHNKFCIIDGMAVWTGSFNPTHRGAESNDNNAVFYQSANMANAYEQEFQEMLSGTFGKGETNEYTEFTINGRKVEVYFCPEDWCANKLIYALQDAEHSIIFMTFSFTHDEVGEAVLLSASNGVAVRGVFEKSQNNQYSEKPKLEDAGLANVEVRWDGNSANMHHKVFIIDNTTVVTGSFNPSRNGDERNDENMLVIHDPEMAGLFYAEFERVWEEAADI